MDSDRLNVSRRSFTSVLLFFIVWLTGCGGGGEKTQPPDNTPHLSLSAATLDFGSLLLQKTTTATVSATNSGTATLQITSIPITGTNAADFVYSGPTLPLSIAPGSSVSLQFTYSPKKEAASSATAIITSNDPSGTRSVSFTGRGIWPAISASPTSISFPSTIPQTASAPVVVTLTSSGSADAVITDIQVVGTDASLFKVQSVTLPLIIPSGKTYNIQLTYSPTASGTHTASLAITYENVPSAYLLALSGSSPDLTQNPAASVLLEPNTASIGDTITVTLRGNLTNFIQGATFANFGPGISVAGTTNASYIPVTVVDPTTATVEITPQSNAAPGPRLVLVKTGDHQSATTLFIPSTGHGPEAIAGTSQFAPVNSVVRLDASASLARAAAESSSSAGQTSTTNDVSLTYNWSLIVPSGSSATLSSATVPNPTFVIDQPGDYLALLKVGYDSMQTESYVLVSTISAPPIAQAGPDQRVNVADVVHLDGSKSSDGDGNPLAYEWQFVSRPVGSSATFSDPHSVVPTFVADADGAYVVQLTVNDSHGNNASDLVTISTQGTTPIANAGPDQRVSPGALVLLDASASTDADGDPLTYLWRFLSRPAGSTAALNDAASATPSFNADLPGTYILQLGVSDPGQNTSLDTMIVSTDVMAPRAVAGLRQNVLIGHTAHLDGSGSSDFDGANLSYHWSLLSKPADSQSSIDAADTATPTLPIDQPGPYVAQLVVKSTYASTPATVLIMGVLSSLEISPDPLVFPSQLVSTTSAPQTFVIANRGSDPVTITDINLSGSDAQDFSFAAVSLPLTLGAGEHLALPLTFTPSHSGTRLASLNINDATANNAHTVPISGTGVAPTADITPSALTFGSVRVGSSGTDSFTITNNGTADLVLSGLTMAGTNPNDFKLTLPTLPLTIKPGANISIAVIFSPTAAGSRTATATITNSASTKTIDFSGTGTAPAIQLSASSLSFGQLLINTSSQQTITISNTGTAILNISAIAIVGTNATDFAYTASALPITVAPGASAPVVVTFTPANVGQRNATLSLMHDAEGSQSSVALSGTGVAPAISLSPTSVNFGDQLVNTSSTQQTITISNTGTSDLVISAMSLSGTNAAEFTPTAPPLPITIPAGKSSVINLTFTPSAMGARTASLNLAHNAQGSPSSIPLSGNGLAPVLEVTPQAINFGNRLLNTTSPASTVTIKNTGNTDLHLSAIALAGANIADFSLTTPAVPLTLQPNGLVALSVTFTPSATGPRSASISVTHDAGGAAFTLALTGNGIAPTFSVNPVSVDFGEQQINIASTPKLLTITNTGTADLVVSQISVTGTDAAAFSFAALTLPMTIAPGNTGNVTVTFKPTTVGNKSAAITFADNANGSPHSVPVAGVGTLPVITLNPVSLDFGTQLVGSTSAQKSFTISNTGTGDLVVSNLDLTGTNVGDFSIVSVTLPFTVRAGSPKTINVMFTPTADVVRTASVRITHNAEGSPSTVSLTGTGIQPVIGIAPANVTFTTPQLVNTTSPESILTLTNTGTADLVISSLTLTGTNPGDFAVASNPLPITITPTNNTTLRLTFTPSAIGVRSATLSIENNAAGHPHSVPLSGTGIQPSISLNPTSLVFDSQLVNTPPVTKTITISNTGTANLVVSQLAITGTNAADFSYTAVLPITVAPQNTTTVSVSFSPNGSGSRTATLTFTDNANGSPHTVSLSGTGIAYGSLIMPPVTIGKDMEKAVTVSLSGNAASDVPVTIVSLDGSKVVFSTDPAVAGTSSVSVTVAKGTTIAYPGFYVQSLASSGTVQIKVTAPGYSTLTTSATLTPSGFVFTNPGGDFTTNTTTDRTLTVMISRLDSNLAPVQDNTQFLRGGVSANVVVNSATTSVATIAGSPLAFTGGNLSKDATFHPVAPGQSVVSIVSPPGFSIPANNTSLTGTVMGPQITLNPATVGRNLQVPGFGSLDTPAPSNGLPVTITSGDPNILLSTDPVAVGGGSITITVPAGGISLPSFYIQSLASSGIAQLTATAPGYASGTGNVAMTPSAFVIAGSSGIGGNFSTTTISPDSEITVTVMRLDPSFQVAQPGTLRAGFSPSVEVSSSATNVGMIFGTAASPDYLVFFHPVGNGTTVLTAVQPAGFSTPLTGGSLTVTVTQPQITLNAAATYIGSGLQVNASGSLNTAAPGDGLAVVISSNNPNVLLSADPAAAGAPSITINIAPGQGLGGKGFPLFFVQGLTATGDVTLTATASGWASGSMVMHLAPSGFVLKGPNGLGADFSILTGQTDANLTVSSVQLNPSTLAMETFQAVRGGSTVSVAINSGNPSVGTIVGTPLSFTPGMGDGSASFHPVSPGQTVISVPAPTGFSTPATYTTIKATVN